MSSIAMAVLIAAAPPFPRIANLWGCSPAATDYDAWSRYDLLVTGGGTVEDWRRFAEQIHARNPHTVLLGTAPLMNIGAPEGTPWMKPEWYLRRPGGEPINWWAGQICAPNLMLDDCLAALTGQTGIPYGELLQAGVVNGVFYDSVVGRVSWYGDVDTNGDGAADDLGDLNPKWHARQCQFFDDLRARWSNMVIMANDVDLGHAPHVNGRLFEGGPLLDQVANGAITAHEAIGTLNRWMTQSAQPAITFAIMTHPLGWQGWRVGKGQAVTTAGEIDRVKRDFARVRLGLAIALMTDAYFAYDFGTTWYGLPLWYAEYDAPLGQALGPAEEVFEVPPQSVLDWQAGGDPGPFTIAEGAVFTADGLEMGEADPSSGWQRLFGTDPARIRFEPGKTYRVEATCDIIEKPTGTIQFNLRTPQGGWEHHDKGVRLHYGETGPQWHLDVTVVPDDFDDYSAEWHIHGAGRIRLREMKVILMNEGYFRREFQGGVALLNPLRHPITIALQQPMRRLSDDAAPKHVVEVDDAEAGCRAQGAWETAAGETGFCGLGYRVAPKPGDTVTWSFPVPEAGQYTVLACVPRAEGLTDVASYELAARGGKLNATLDQRHADGGWMELFEAELVAGEECGVVLTSGGIGATAADAIRVESAARYNDGSKVEQVTLGALDGVVLLLE